MDKTTSKARFLFTGENNTNKAQANKRKNIMPNKSATNPMRAMRIMSGVMISPGTIKKRIAPTKTSIVRIR